MVIYKNIKPALMMVIVAVSIHLPASASNTGKELFNELCASCHVHKSGSRIAPPLFAIKTLTRLSYPQRAEFINRVVDWVKEPTLEGALMQDAVKIYGVMPQLGYDESDVRKVAEYIYDGR